MRYKKDGHIFQIILSKTEISMSSDPKPTFDKSNLYLVITKVMLSINQLCFQLDDFYYLHLEIIFDQTHTLTQIVVPTTPGCFSQIGLLLCCISRHQITISIKCLIMKKTR